ncbi:cingulin-like [Gossypium australe]|uniref:Cingulin-like n=1 Tax=Gossypium australe TaxID=47621 RepID=A0A5B6WVD3_9ROSI|nr:cingulin-like [Gossypium australe]
MEKQSMGETITKRSKWQYPPPQPAPKILHLPPRPKRKPPLKPSKLPSLHNETKGKQLVNLFDQERCFKRGLIPLMLVNPMEESNEEMKREKVEEEEEEHNGGVVAFVEEEKWKFQAEMLRAECNLLRIERDVVVKKIERSSVKMEKTLKSAVHTLVSGRNNICEGNDVRMILEELINELLEKLEKMQKRTGVKDLEAKKCSNFDQQACFLRTRLDKFGEFSDKQIRAEEIREMAEASLSIKTSSQSDESLVSNRNNNVEILRRNMERLSQGVLFEGMAEEYGLMTSSGNSSKRIDYSDSSPSSTQRSDKEKMSGEPRECSGHCKAIVRRIVEQVRAETEQWSQMQDMLGQVRDEMEELQKCRDYWEDRALDSDYQIRSLKSAVKEWRQKAHSSEAKASELQARMFVLHEEIERLRNERERKTARDRNTLPANQEARNETEKRILMCDLKENRCANDDGCKAQTCTATGLLPRRSPLRELGNMSALMKQHGEGILPLFCLRRDPETKCSF